MSLLHDFNEVEMHEAMPIDIDCLRIQAVVTCKNCREQWVITTDILNSAIRLLRPNLSITSPVYKQYITLYREYLKSRALDFISYHSNPDPNSEDLIKYCEAKIGVKNG